MDANSAMSFGQNATFQPHSTQGFVLCCLCGTNILPNPSNMCVNCIRSQVDITEGIQKQLNVLYCKHCGRYLQPPRHWVRAELESKELLTYCIKRIKGLSKVKLVDAGFVWTEPHSRRIKVKLTIQAEVFNGAILQQTFVVEFVVEDNMCLDCNRSSANPNSWIACVQLRQHVYHKRTFLYLEQLILKHGASDQCVNIRAIHQGVDFFFGQRAHAIKFINFLQGVVPIRYRHDKQLVSHDEHTSTYNYKYTFSVEIVPVCKDDLICLPSKMAASYGGVGPIVLCTRVTNVVQLTDTATLRTLTLDTEAYFKWAPLTSIANQRQMIEYMVLDVELTGQTAGKFGLADVQVARTSDMGKVYHARTHLGNLLHPGDVAVGYDVANANYVGLDLEAFLLKGGQLPDVVLVRKSYEEGRRRRRQRGESRPWKLKQLDMEVEEVKDKKGGAADAEEEDRERFMQELEEDPDMRKHINIYKDHAAITAAQQRPPRLPHEIDEMGDSDDGDDAPQVPLEELLDDLEALGLGDGGEHDDGVDDDDDEMMDD